MRVKCYIKLFAILIIIECFINLIEEIKTLNLCKSCNRMDDNFCKKCEMGNMIDELTIAEMNEDDECPICYKNYH